MYDWITPEILETFGSKKNIDPALRMGITPSREGIITLEELIERERKDREPEPKDEGPGVGTIAYRGLMRGVAGLGESTATIGQYIGERVGAEGFAEKAGEISERIRKGAEERWPEPPDIAGKNIIENPELLANSSYWVFNVAQILPSLAATIIPAGAAGSVVKIGSKAFPWVAKSAERLIRLGQFTAGFGVGGGLEAAQTYKEVLRQGGSEEEAARSAEAMFLGAGALNAVGVDKILAKAGPGFKAKVIKHFGAGAWEGFTEGLEEPTEVLSKVIGKYISGEDVPSDIMAQVIESLKDAATVAPVAAVTGLGGSLVAGGRGRLEDVPKSKTVDLGTANSEGLPQAVAKDVLDAKTTKDKESKDIKNEIIKGKKKDIADQAAEQAYKGLMVQAVETEPERAAYVKFIEDQLAADEQLRQSQKGGQLLKGQLREEAGILTTEEEASQKVAEEFLARPKTFERPVDETQLTREGMRDQLIESPEERARRERTERRARLAERTAVGPIEAGRRLKEAERRGFELPQEERSEYERIIKEAERPEAVGRGIPEEEAEGLVKKGVYAEPRFPVSGKPTGKESLQVEPIAPVVPEPPPTVPTVAPPTVLGKQPEPTPKPPVAPKEKAAPAEPVPTEPAAEPKAKAKDNIDSLIEEYNAAGWLAWRHPKKKTISLNGAPAIPYAEAMTKMREALKSKKPVPPSAVEPVKPDVVFRVDNAINRRQRENILIEEGYKAFPEIRPQDAQDAGQWAYTVAKGEATQDQFDAWKDQMRKERRVTDVQPEAKPDPAAGKVGLKGATGLDVKNLTENDIQNAIKETPTGVMIHPPSVDELVFYQDDEGSYRGIAIKWNDGRVGFAEKNKSANDLLYDITDYRQDKRFDSIKKTIEKIKPAPAPTQGAKPKPPVVKKAEEPKAAPEVQNPANMVSKSGRKLSPYPDMKITSVRQANKSSRETDQWLINEAILEAQSIGDDFNETVFKTELPIPKKGLPQATIDSAHEYLFGREKVRFDRTIKEPKPETPEAEPDLAGYTKDQLAGVKVKVPVLFRAVKGDESSAVKRSMVKEDAAKAIRDWDGQIEQYYALLNCVQG